MSATARCNLRWTITTRGTRGSIATAGEHARQVGGATSMLEIRTPTLAMLIDAGSATPSVAPPGPGQQAELWFTHYHLDHIVGLPFLPWLYDPSLSVNVHGVEPDGQTLRQAYTGPFQRPWFPLDLSDAARANLVDNPIQRDGSAQRGELSLSWLGVSHPGGAIAIRFEIGDKSLVYAPDVELRADDTWGRLLELASGADVLVIDAHFSDEEYHRYKGWGHSTARQAAAFAKEAEVGQLKLTHHAPFRSDDEVRALAARARETFQETSLAYDNELLLHG